MVLIPWYIQTIISSALVDIIINISTCNYLIAGKHNNFNSVVFTC